MISTSQDRDISFVCCIESGSLETLTLRMIESLRRWGGNYSSAPIFAVTPRFGSPLSKKTRKELERLKVNYLYEPQKTIYQWYDFINKPNSLLIAEKYIKTNLVAWIDSDILFVDEPEQLFLNPDESFAACAINKIGATTGVDSNLESYWACLADAIGLDIKTLPWVVGEQDQEKMRFYLNGGVFLYRYSSGFGRHYFNTCISSLDKKVVSEIVGIYMAEQISLALTVIKNNFNWRLLPLSHNYSFNKGIYPNYYSDKSMKEARIIHYHDSMWGDFYIEFINCMKRTHPKTAAWLSSLEPLSNTAPYRCRLFNKTLKHLRKYKENRYLHQCKVL